MKFRRLIARRFGPLAERTFELGEGVHLVFGPNESGKSSFRTALETVLFGFEPATRDAHPLHNYAAAPEGDLHLEADLVLDGGRVLRVERLLQATGKCRIAEEDAEFEGPRRGNAALPEVGATSRDLYRSIHSLSSDDLSALDQRVQERVDHLLLPEGHVDGLRPIFAVLRGLREERDALWRSDRRGRPRIVRLQKELHELRREYGRAAVHEEGLVEMRVERERALARRDGLTAELERLEEVERDAQPLGELWELLQRERQRPPAVDLSELGDDALVSPADLRHDIDELTAQLDRPTATLDAPAESLDDQEIAVLERADELDESLGEVALHKSEVARRVELVEEAQGLEATALAELDTLLAHRPTRQDLDRACELPIEALRAARDAWSTARARAEEESRRIHTGAASILSLLLVLTGVVLVALASVGDAPGDVGLAGLVALLAAMPLVWRAAQRGSSAQAPELDPAVAERLRSLGAAPELFESPASMARLVESLERARRAFHQGAQAREAAWRIAESLGDREAAWLDTCRELGLGEPERPAARLRQVLEAAVHRRDEVRADRERRRAARELVDSHRPALERKRERLARLTRALRANVPDATDVDLAHEEIVDRLQEERALAKRRAELERHPEHGRLAASPWLAKDELDERAPWLAAPTSERRARIAELRGECDAIHHRLGEIQATFQNDRGSLEARAREEVVAAEEELDACRRERDLLALAERLLSRADQEYREEHQPDVLRRASEHLEAITGGRYRRLDFPDGPEGGLFVTAKQENEPRQVAPPLSRGTRDQIYLALRLGLLDHLDEARERLPLVLDEAMAHADAGRRIELWRMLARVGESRQVFLLTCHEEVAREVENALGLRRIELAPPTTPGDGEGLLRPVRRLRKTDRRA